MSYVQGGGEWGLDCSSLSQGGREDIFAPCAGFLFFGSPLRLVFGTMLVWNGTGFVPLGMAIPGMSPPPVHRTPPYSPPGCQ